MRRVILVFLLSLIVFWVVLVTRGSTPIIDEWTGSLLGTINSSETIYVISRHITDFGSKPFLIPFTVVMAFVLFILYRNWLPSFLFAGGTLLTHGFNQLFKVMIQRERPRIWIEASAEGYSFPSGHAMIPLVCYGLLAYFLSQKIKHILFKRLLYTTFTILILTIGLSRYIINVHYMTDVLSGFVFGYILLIGIITLYETIRKYEKN